MRAYVCVCACLASFVLIESLHCAAFLFCFVVAGRIKRSECN